MSREKSEVDFSYPRAVYQRGDQLMEIMGYSLQIPGGTVIKGKQTYKRILVKKLDVGEFTMVDTMSREELIDFLQTYLEILKGENAR